ncbi:MAG: DUF2779 domain-containing protein [Gammaproteobacteria bacterium]|nr:DUF2779 domain-containing protein [Gammaproteobacteria bacterium]
MFYVGKGEYKNLNQENSFLKALAEGGFQVGELAKYLHPGGHEISSLNHAEAEAETLEWLKQDEITLFEPAIRFGDLFVRIDILVKRGNTFRIIEVKAKSYDSENPEIAGKRTAIVSGMLPYIQDVAFQTYVLKSACPGSIVTSFLMMPDKSKVATIDGLNQLFKFEEYSGRAKVVSSPLIKSGGCGDSVLTEVNVDEFVNLVMSGGVEYPGGVDSLPALAQGWAEAYTGDTRIPPVIGAHCANCEFRAEIGDVFKSGFHECWKDSNNWTDQDFCTGTVLDLWNYRGKSDLIRHGILKLSQVTQDDLKYKEGEDGLSNSQRQWMQVSGIPGEDTKRGFYFDSALMQGEMADWKFPYHFIDFETSAVALPFYKGMRPYEQVAFQFSHHVLNADGRVEHVGEFLLTEPGEFPNFKFAEALKEQLDKDDGSVFMWSPHENTILKRIITQLGDDVEVSGENRDLVAFLNTLIRGGSRAMIDLCALAQKAYFHPDTKGSSSIKKVLPSVLNSSRFLRKKYNQPVYGSCNGIPSKNYTNYTWWSPAPDGRSTDPYHLLKTCLSDMLGDKVESFGNEDEFSISEGGAAASAYSRLQFECLDEQSRVNINQSLMRYCELDTLAMVMIVEAWQNWAAKNSSSIDH